MRDAIYEGIAQYIGISHKINEYVYLEFKRLYRVRMINTGTYTKVCLLDTSGNTYASIDYWGIAVNLCWRRVESLPYRGHSTCAQEVTYRFAAT